MRGVLGTLLGVLLFAHVARGELVFSDAALDLGKVRAAPIFEQRLPLINNRTAAVDAIEVKAVCNVVKADVDPRVIPGGQKSYLLLKINTLSASPAQHAWRVTVKSRSSGQEQETAMLIRAQIFQEIIV